ncbi:MAG: 2-C-methyl-D-erythritol 2,4-cyclodiphosphate synthase [Bdellovibrionales bacterium]|nr:2-C-methyl-D-erythritol 2,4-cyclodiphosphate synthase [Bdellovibrionales bacterium]
MIRIGQGFDMHRFEKGKALMLGGVHIPHEWGLQGHSDGDALLHAICDALLGALSLGDLGKFFSDTDARHKNRSSMEFVDEVYGKIQAQGYVLGNLDSTILTEKPKLAPYIEEMKSKIAQALSVDVDQISIKATRPESMGALGRDEGLAAMASVILLKKIPAQPSDAMLC